MRFLKWPLLILLALILIYAILCAVGPKNLNLTRTQKVNAPAPFVFNQINNLPAWENWSSWNINDPDMQISYTKLEEGVGAKSTWTSEAQGNGTQEIIESVKNEKLKTKLMFEEWGGSAAYGLFELKENKGKTEVSWSMDSGDDFPFLQRGLMLVLGMKGDIKKNYDASLKNIKRIVEERNSGKYGDYNVKEITVPEKRYMINRAEVNLKGIQQFYATNFSSIASKLGESQLEMDGMPSGLFFKYNTKAGTADMAAAIPVKEDTDIEDVESFLIPEKSGLRVDYYGDYNGTTAAHEAIEAYMDDRGLLSDVPMVEEYVTDPGEEKDPTKWLTRVTYYLAAASN
jgi:effector-binding domain-containing protein